MCWSGERSKQSREEGGRTRESHTRTYAHTQQHTHTHTHLSDVFPSCEYSLFLPGTLTERRWTTLALPFTSPHPIHTHTHTHTHSQTRTGTHFSTWFRDDTSGWVWSVSKGLWLLFSTTHTRTHKPHTLLWRASVELGTHPVWRLQSLALLSAV